MTNFLKSTVLTNKADWHLAHSEKNIINLDSDSQSECDSSIEHIEDMEKDKHLLN